MSWFSAGLQKQESIPSAFKVQQQTPRARELTGHVGGGQSQFCGSGAENGTCYSKVFHPGYRC